MTKTKAPRYRCHKCGKETVAYAPMERHVDKEHDGHGRIECLPGAPLRGTIERRDPHPYTADVDNPDVRYHDRCARCGWSQDNPVHRGQ